VGIGYLDRVVLKGDARVFEEGGRGKCRLRLVPEGLGCFKSVGGECVGSIEEFEYLLHYLCLPFEWEGVGEVGLPRVPYSGGLFL